jgi:hypothetical protein
MNQETMTFTNGCVRIDSKGRIPNQGGVLVRFMT